MLFSLLGLALGFCFEFILLARFYVVRAVANSVSFALHVDLM